MITLNKLVKWYSLEGVLITSDHCSAPWKAATMTYGREFTGTGDTPEEALEDLDDALFQMYGRRNRAWIKALKVFIRDPIWTTLCFMYGVPYGEWNFECWDVVHECGGLNGALEVCGYSDTTDLKWNMLMGMARRGGD